MKTVFFGYPFCNLRTFQRLLLVASEISFIDRPSVMFGRWGMIGRASDIRQFKTDGLPLKIGAQEPPSGPAYALYAPFVQNDIGNEVFVKTVAEGLARSDHFASKFIQFEADYGGMKGRELRQVLVDDQMLALQTYADVESINPTQGARSAEGRRDNFLTCLVEASVHVTTGLVVAERVGAAPVTDDPYMSRLMALRTADRHYLGTSYPMAEEIGLAIAQAVVPDAALEHLTVRDILDYRSSTKDAYDAWLVEVARLGAVVQDTEPDRVNDRLRALIATEVAPRVLEYRNEMASARDRLWGDLIKSVAKWELPTMSLAWVAGLSLPSALALFAAAAPVALHGLVDYYNARREIARRHAASYLVRVMPAS